MVLIEVSFRQIHPFPSWYSYFHGEFFQERDSDFSPYSSSSSTDPPRIPPKKRAVNTLQTSSSSYPYTESL